MRIKRMMTLCAMVIGALCLAVLPNTAWAEIDYTMEFSLNGVVNWQEGVYINYATEDAHGSGWQWSHSDKTLTLTGLRFETANPVALKLPAGATLHLAAGTVNTLTSSCSALFASNVSSICLDCTGDLAITGSGTLTVNAGVRAGDGHVSYALQTAGRLTIYGGTLVARGNVSKDSVSVGVFSALAPIALKGGKLTAQGYTKAIEPSLTFDPKIIAARGSTNYNGTKLVAYNASANPPQQYVETFDAPTVVPKTGDSTPLVLLCGLTLLSGGAFLILCLHKRNPAHK